jgi:hypothetical protein
LIFPVVGRFRQQGLLLKEPQLDRLERFDRDLKQMDAKLEVKLKPYARQMELLDGVLLAKGQKSTISINFR